MMENDLGKRRFFLFILHSGETGNQLSWVLLHHHHLLLLLLSKAQIEHTCIMFRKWQGGRRGRGEREKRRRTERRRLFEQAEFNTGFLFSLSLPACVKLKKKSARGVTVWKKKYG